MKIENVNSVNTLKETEQSFVGGELTPSLNSLINMNTSCCLSSADQTTNRLNDKIIASEDDCLF